MDASVAVSLFRTYKKPSCR